MPKLFQSVILMFVLVVCQTSFSQKDTLVATNGNILIGEIKSMNKGVLKMKTSFSDSDFAIEWSEVKRLVTTTEYLISTTNGERYNGSLQSTATEALLILKENDTLATTHLKYIVYLKSVKSSFWDKLSASLSLGYNFTKSNNFKQFSIRNTLGYQATKWSLNSSYNNIASSRDDVNSINRIDAALTYNYFLKNDWFPLAEINWLSNTEQNLQLRTVSKLGIGKFVFRDNQKYLGLQTGISYNNENYSGSDENSLNSAEAFLGAELNLYDVGDLNLLTKTIAYPSLTESGRWRFDAAIDLQYDLPLDFFIKAGLTVNYDNQSIASTGPYDYIVQTTFGWKL